MNIIVKIAEQVGTIIIMSRKEIIICDSCGKIIHNKDEDITKLEEYAGYQTNCLTSDGYYTERYHLCEECMNLMLTAVNDKFERYKKWR